MLSLPWPPSANMYYRHVGAKVLISRAGRKYRELVGAILRSENFEKFSDKVEMTVDAYPPDRRRRDADNLEKCLWDSLVKGGLIEDDSLIKRHTTTMREPINEGLLLVEVKEYEGDDNHEY